MKPGRSGDTAGAEARRLAARTALPLRRIIVLLAVGAFIAGSATASERSITDQLKRMSAAMRSLSYEGTLVYLHDDRLETLHIVHRIENGRVHERIVSLNGPVRTVTREQDEVTCELANSTPFSVRRHGGTLDLLRSNGFDPNALSSHYLVHPLGRARVAGKQTDVVGVIPRDDLRYGYRFYLDVDTGLPLKSDLMGQSPEPIEQVMFTALSLLPAGDAPASKITDAPDAEGPRAKAPPRAETVAAEEDPWRFVSLPAGFSLVMRDHWQDVSGRPVQHFVLSDGLASVSVYVENGDQDGLQGATRIGAIHAAGGRVAGHQVTIVGEVPPSTVEAVLAGIRYEGHDTP
jgi:sigma-E factor negative regulatory protein RseB